MKVTIVGCSGSFPGPDSPSSSYLVEAEDDERVWRILLDMGSGSLGALQRVLDPRQLDAVVITHLHPDHFMDLCGLYIYRRYHPEGSPALPLPVYGPTGIADRLAVSYGLPEGKDVRTIFDLIELSDQANIKVGPLTITSRLMVHTVQAYAVRLEHHGRVLAYSGDTDICDNLVEVAKDADLFLSEAAFQEGREEVRGVHMTGRRAGQIATQARVQHMVLTHIPVWTDADVVRAEAAEVFSGPITVARSLESYVLTGLPTPIR